MAINDMIGAKGWEQKTDYYKDLYDVILSPFALQMFTATRAQLASRILDVGCGTGLAAKMFSSSFMGPGKQYVGIDPTPSMLSIADESLRNSSLGRDPKFSYQ